MTETEQRIALLDMEQAVQLMRHWNCCAESDLAARGEWSCDWNSLVLQENLNYQGALLRLNRTLEPV